MKNDSKKSFVIAASITMSLLLGLSLNMINFQDVKAQSTIVCKWEQEDCPGIFTGSREVCLTSGDGNTCTCGTVTRKCGGDSE